MHQQIAPGLWRKVFPLSPHQWSRNRWGLSGPSCSKRIAPAAAESGVSISRTLRMLARPEATVFWMT
jgi:hypothetical protein